MYFETVPGSKRLWWIFFRRMCIKVRREARSKTEGGALKLRDSTRTRTGGSLIYPTNNIWFVRSLERNQTRDSNPGAIRWTALASNPTHPTYGASGRQDHIQEFNVMLHTALVSVLDECQQEKDGLAGQKQDNEIRSIYQTAGVFDKDDAILQIIAFNIYISSLSMFPSAYGPVNHAKDCNLFLIYVRSPLARIKRGSRSRFPDIEEVNK
ncbi:hypothetical protein CBL_06784 [Carabus blaptoides fortunei]